MDQDTLTKLASSGWADFHTEFKIPRGVRKQLRRWVDRLEWPENHTKHDAREYHITVLDMDTYDADFAKWAKEQVRGRELHFKSTGMAMFNDFVVVRLECPEWEELARDWTEEAEKRGLEPHTFDGGPKAHVSVGRSHDKKWPKGIPNPHIKFKTRMFNIKRNSVWHEAAPGDEWQPGAWGKGMYIGGEPRVWETTAPDPNSPYEMEPTHAQMALQLNEEAAHKTKIPITINPSGHYVGAPHWGDWTSIETPAPDLPLVNKERQNLMGKLDSYAQLHPGLQRVTPEQWKEINEAQSNPTSGYGHAQNVLDILNKQGMAVDPEFVNKWMQPQNQWGDAKRYLYHGRQDPPEHIRANGIEGGFSEYHPTPSVYLTSNPGLAEHFAEHPGIEPEYGDPTTQAEMQPNVYKIDPSKLDPNLIEADEWNVQKPWPEGHEYHGEGYSMTPEMLQHVSDPEVTQHQWESDHPLAYRGTIPPEAIVDHYPMINGEPGEWDSDLRVASVEATPADELKQWLDTFEEPQAVAPTPYHSSPDQFAPYQQMQQAQGPHVDPPAKPYKPYDWAEEGWEEPIMNREAASPDEEMFVQGEGKPPVTVNEVFWSQTPTGRPRYVPAPNEYSRRPFLYNTQSRQIYLGQPGMIHSEMYNQAGVPSSGVVRNYEHGELARPKAWINPTMLYHNDYRQLPDRDEIRAALEQHTGEPFDIPPRHAAVDTHLCPKCGEDIEGPICNVCGYDPRSADSSYERMKKNWYDRAWSDPGNQPHPLPERPIPWREDHAHDISLASVSGGWHGF